MSLWPHFWRTLYALELCRARRSLHERQQFVKGFLDATESITANHYRRGASQTPLPATLEQGVV